jgi:hypothetical protein
MTRNLCGPQSRSELFEEKKNFFLLPGIEPRNLQPVAESLLVSFEEKKNFFPLPGIEPRNLQPVAESLLVSSINQQCFIFRPLLYKFWNYEIHYLIFSNPASIPQQHIAPTLQTSIPRCYLGKNNHIKLLR